MSSIKGLKTTKLSALIGKTVSIRELRDEEVSIITAFDTTSGEAFILSGEIKEAKAIEPKQMTEQNDIFVLSRRGKEDLKPSTVKRYDRAEEVILMNPRQLRKIIELRNERVTTKNIAKQLHIPRTSVNLFISVAIKRDYIVTDGNRFKFTNKFADACIKAAG